MYQNIHVERVKYSHERIIHLWDDEAGYIRERWEPYFYVINEEHGDYETIYGNKCIKVRKSDASSYDDSKAIETDILDATRYLVDKYYDNDQISTGHRVLTYDIEVEVTQGFPYPDLAENRITSIGFHDSITDEYFVYVLDPEGLVDEEYIEGVQIVRFSEEHKLLIAFVDYVEGMRPTIITGWNIDFFDTTYLFNRISKLVGQKTARRLSPIGTVYFMKKRNRYHIAGVSSLDYIQLYKKFTFTKAASYSLDFISNAELGVGKVDFDGSINDLYSTDRNKFVLYNITDVKRVVQLDKKLEFIELARVICHAGRVPYEDYIYSSRYLEGAILTLLKQKNLVSRNIEKSNYKIDDDDSYEGAYVKQPQVGRYEWVYDLDLTSLYPSIIMTLNISPETKLFKITNWDAEIFSKRETYTWKLDTGREVSNADLHSVVDNEPYSISINGVIYRTDVVGCIPELLKVWFDKRKEYQRLMEEYDEAGDVAMMNFYDKRQYVQKVLLNSVYGVLGLSIFRFYDLDNAEAVTITGQSVIHNTAEKANEFYSKVIGTTDVDYVIYMDTDSIFMPAVPMLEHKHGDSYKEWATDTIASEVFSIADEVQVYVNKYYDEMAQSLFNTPKHRFQIKKEFVASSGIFLSKKRYAQWIVMQKGMPRDEMDVKGIDVVKSSFPPAFKGLVSEVLVSILQGKNRDEIDDIIYKFKRKINRIHYREIAKNVSVNFKKYEVEHGEGYSLFDFKKHTPGHVKATLAFNQLLSYFDERKYEEIQEGDSIKWVYLKPNPYGLDGLAFTDNTPPSIQNIIETYIYKDKIFERELSNKLDDFYEALGWGLTFKDDKPNPFF